MAGALAAVGFVFPKFPQFRRPIFSNEWNAPWNAWPLGFGGLEVAPDPMFAGVPCQKNPFTHLIFFWRVREVDDHRLRFLRLGNLGPDLITPKIWEG